MSWGSTGGSRGRRAAFAVVAAAALVGGLGSAAFAETYRTPGNEAAVGTLGSGADAQYLAVSDSGTATAWNGVAIGGLGSANGLVALSGTNWANGTVAASGLGSANGSLLAGSIAGSASSPLAAFSALGTASGWTAAVSGTGTANSSAYNSVAVSGTGNANGNSPNGVAVSPGGNAYGGSAGVTVWGNSGGGTASVAPDRTRFTAETTVWDALEAADVYYNMGVSQVPNARQAWIEATAGAPDPASTAQKLKAYAETVPVVLQALAGETPNPNDPPPSPPTQEEIEEMISLGSTSANGGPYTMYGWTFGVAPTARIAQQGRSCGIASAFVTWSHRGLPSYAQMMEDLGGGLTTPTTLVRYLTRHYSGPSAPILSRTSNPVDLLSWVRTVVDNYNQGATISVNTAWLDWWYRPDGTVREGLHQLSVYAYWTGPATDRPSFFQVWDTGNGRTGNDGWSPPRVAGASEHIVEVDELYAAATGATPGEAWMIW